MKVFSADVPYDATLRTKQQWHGRCNTPETYGYLYYRTLVKIKFLVICSSNNKQKITQEVFIKTNEACLGYVYVIIKTVYFTVTISEKLLSKTI